MPSPTTSPSGRVCRDHVDRRARRLDRVRGAQDRRLPHPAALGRGAAPLRIADLLTVALLAALVAVQTLGAGQAIVVDARLPAVLVAAGLLLLRAPFLVVVIAAALVAALLRLWGWAA